MLGKTIINKTISVENIPMYNTGRNVWNSIVELVNSRIKGSSSKFKTLYEADVEDYELATKQPSYGTI